MAEPSSRESPRASTGWIGLSFVAGLLGGAAMFALLPIARTGASEGPLAIDGLDELNRRVQELTQEMQSLRTATPRLALAGEAAARASVEPLQTSTDSDLKALIAKLDELLGQQDAARKLGVTGGAAPLVIPDSTRTEPARKALIENGREHVSTDNFLMTYQQIVERYGRPSMFWKETDGNVVRWTYTSRDDSNRQVTFLFLDGLVSGWQ